MILFKSTHVEMILGKSKYLKTETRRRGKKAWNVGAIHICQTNYQSSSAFARVKILSVKKEMLFEITQLSASKEGYASVEDFKNIWETINGEWINIPVWVIEFKVTEDLTIMKNEDVFKYF